MEEWKGVQVGMHTREMFYVLAPQETIMRWEDPDSPKHGIVHEYFEDTATGEKCIIIVKGYIADDPKAEHLVPKVEQIWKAK